MKVVAPVSEGESHAPCLPKRSQNIYMEVARELFPYLRKKGHGCVLMRSTLLRCG